LVGMDFNIDPMTATVFQMDDDNQTLFLLDEIEIYGSNTDEMAEELIVRYGDYEITIFPDPSCVASKTSAGGRTDLSILQSYGFRCKFRRQHPFIRDRINSVNSRLCSSVGERKLLVNKSCRISTRAFERHSYKEGTNLPEKGGKPDYSHITDSIGYLVEYLFPVSKREMVSTRLTGI